MIIFKKSVNTSEYGNREIFSSKTGLKFFFVSKGKLKSFITIKILVPRVFDLKNEDRML